MTLMVSALPVLATLVLGAYLALPFFHSRPRDAYGQTSQGQCHLCSVAVRPQRASNISNSHRGQGTRCFCYPNFEQDAQYTPLN
jgi:hypothetical protein